jgi:hypothetical protein
MRRTLPAHQLLSAHQLSSAHQHVTLCPQLRKMVPTHGAKSEQPPLPAWPALVPALREGAQRVRPLPCALLMAPGTWRLRATVSVALELVNSPQRVSLRFATHFEVSYRSISHVLVAVCRRESQTFPCICHPLTLWHACRLPATEHIAKCVQQ